MNIFIIGTDIDVGKTVVTAGVSAVMQSLGYQMGVFKPIQTGCCLKKGKVIVPDLDFIKNTDLNINVKSSYNFKLNANPDLSAQVEKRSINLEFIREDYLNFSKENDLTIVEGVGGIMTPVYKDLLMSDIAKALKLPVVIVANPFLGQINSTLLTVKYAQAVGLEVKGIIINRYPVATRNITIKSFADYIYKLSGVEIIGVLPELKFVDDKVNPEILITETLKNIKLETLFDLQIPKLSGF